MQINRKWSIKCDKESKSNRNSWGSNKIENLKKPLKIQRNPDDYKK